MRPGTSSGSVVLARTEAAARHLTEYMKGTDRMAKTIVFCVDAEHAAQMRQALANANADIVRSHPDYVVRIVSDEGDTGRLHLGDFADPERETPVIATTAQLLSTGVDLPDGACNIVLFQADRLDRRGSSRSSAAEPACTRTGTS